VAASFRAASGNTWTAATSVTPTKPTGSTTGDWVGCLIHLGNTADIPSVTAGWQLIQQTVNGNNSQSFVVHRVLDGSSRDADPVISWPTSSRGAWAAEAWTPGAGEVLTIDAEATVASLDASSATNTPNSATPSSGNSSGVSIVLAAPRGKTNGATAITTTPPSGWTEPSGGDQSTASGTGARQCAAEVSHKSLASNATVTPGSLTSSQTVSINLHHLILQSAAAAGPGVPTPRANITPGNTGTTITSGSFTPSANSLLVATMWSEQSTGTLTPSDSLGGTWTRVPGSPWDADDDQQGVLEIWTRPVGGSPASR
jgi:hypothetical protein